jgi:ubiquinone/menaquinone biosynthesis C-methylase UbiE
VLGSVPDQPRALAEIRRVLRPGGELRFYEHVVPHRQPKRPMLQAADRSRIWPAVAGGCHLSRDTTGEIMQADFDTEKSSASASAHIPFCRPSHTSSASPGAPSRKLS